MLGVTQEEAIGRFCGDLLRPLPVDGVLPCDSSCPILQARFRGPVRALERIRPAGGSEFAAVLSSSPEAGGLQVQILHEESPDEAARRSRDAVVADLAHELKTPLAAQRASLELLRERLASGAGAGDAAAVELAAGVEAGALRLERLIDNLLESVRIESGELAIRRAPVDLEEVVEEAIATTAALFAKRKQALTIELPYPLPRLTGDSPRLTQALVNLLANAAKYAPEGSEAVVGGTVGACDVAIWVENEGPGLSPADLPRLSARYRRGLDEASRAEAPEAGSGLGLWIARSIAERHGGELGAERLEREGRSRTRVILRLPAAESAA
jgi:signal transduction histidine kinase